MVRFRNSVWALFAVMFLLVFASWDYKQADLIGPIPQKPDYDDPTQWYMQDRQGVADIFYIISTETGDHLMGGDTCHFADTRNPVLRKKMLREMYAVDSFYSDKLNYYSPYYRQATMQSWGSMNTAMVRLPIALSDVKRSWAYYLEHYNQGRPFIIAGFSQGAYAVRELLKDMPDSVYRRMIAAYTIGFRITEEDLRTYPNIRPAQGATDLGVTICYNSVRSPECAIPIVSADNVVCINPVNWRTDTVATPFIFRGSKKDDTLSVHCDPESHLLIVKGYDKEHFLPVIGRPGSYHYRELKFYYPYIRKNMADRVEAYFERQNREGKK